MDSQDFVISVVCARYVCIDALVPWHMHTTALTCRLRGWLCEVGSACLSLCGVKTLISGCQALQSRHHVPTDPSQQPLPVHILTCAPHSSYLTFYHRYISCVDIQLWHVILIPGTLMYVINCTISSLKKWLFSYCFPVNFARVAILYIRPEFLSLLWRHGGAIRSLDLLWLL